MRRNWTPRRSEGIWKIRCYQVGQTAEKVKYRIPPRIEKNKEKIRREIARQERKAGQGLRAICRTANANFYRDKGYLLELTFSEAGYRKLLSRIPAELLPEEMREEAAGMEPEALRKEIRDALLQAAQKEMELWMRRVHRQRRIDGSEFQYWGIRSDMNGKTGEPVRVHCHVLVDLESLAECVRKWTLGTVEYKQLWDEPDHNDLVAYLLKQVRVKGDQKRYTPSRNLVQPKPVWERTVYSDAELRVPNGCSLITRAEVNRGEPQYIRYILPLGTSAQEDEQRGDNGNGVSEASGHPGAGKKARGTVLSAAEHPGAAKGISGKG